MHDQGSYKVKIKRTANVSQIIHITNGSIFSDFPMKQLFPSFATSTKRKTKHSQQHYNTSKTVYINDRFI